MTIEFSALSGKMPKALAEDISAAIFKALEAGMEHDAAASITVAVAADYWRGAYGSAGLSDLAQVVVNRAAHPLPGSAP